MASPANNPTPRPAAVVLLSGGLDSATAAAIARADGFDLLALSFRYGQRHAIEIDAARAVARQLGVREHVIANIDLRVFGGSALTADIDVPKADAPPPPEPPASPAAPAPPAPSAPAIPLEPSARTAPPGPTARTPLLTPSDPAVTPGPAPPLAPAAPGDQLAPPSAGGRAIPITYVPARNTIFLAYALAMAEARGARDIYLGVNAIDYSGYPDCRPEYIAAFERMAALATRAGVEGRPTRIRAPLIAWSKAQIIRRGLELGVDYAVTRSCYDPDERGAACGRCESCRLRLAAFAQAGLDDPAPYQPGRP